MLYLYNLIGGGSTSEYFRSINKHVLQDRGFEGLTKDLIGRCRLLKEAGIEAGVWFHNPGGLSERLEMTLDQLSELKRLAPQLHQSYLDSVKKLRDEGIPVVSYVGPPSDPGEDYIGPFEELQKIDSQICIDALGVMNSLENFFIFCQYWQTRYGGLIAEGEPYTSHFDVCLATGNQPWNWVNWLSVPLSSVQSYIILQGKVQSGWPEPSMAQARAIACLGMNPVLDFWKVDKTTIQQWFT